MINNFLSKTSFVSTKDFAENYKVNVPENFNFAYDVVDEWAKKDPNKSALCWVNDKGEHIKITYKELKEKSDKAASFFLQQGIKKADMVMLILKRRYQFWYAIIGLHKIGAIAIPATHLLTKKDLVYKIGRAHV